MEVEKYEVTEDMIGFRGPEGFIEILKGFRPEPFVQRCARCKSPGVVKSRMVDGRRQGVCKACDDILSDRYRTKRSYVRNPLTGQVHELTDDEKRERRRAWREENRERLREQNRRYYLANRYYFYEKAVLLGIARRMSVRQ